MKAMQGFALFWYHFIIGDDWRIAVAVVVGLVVTYLLSHSGHTAVWWLLPLMVVSMLSVSLWLATRRK